jgi:UDP-N-acetylmuramoylalanine--D-glutamate ligase
MGVELKGRRVAVFGLAKSGLSAARLLLERGAQVTLVDARGEPELGEPVARLKAGGAALAVGPGASTSGVLSRQDLVVVSPGVPLALAEIRAARGAGVPVWGEVELASRLLRPAPVVAITGTNGKSTTTALTGEMFLRAGRTAFVGGNLGTPLSEAVLDGRPYDAYVVELSSFQLEGTEGMRASGAALLNLTPDHIDRYADLAEYGAAKARIFRNQAAGDFAVVNADDAEVMRLATAARVPVYGFSLTGRPVAEAPRLAGLAQAGEGGFTLRLSTDAGPESYRLANRALRGGHNAQNAMAAALLARLTGLTAGDVQRGLDGYPGLPHRLEFVRELDGVEWVNDSKATNVDSTLVALAAFPAGPAPRVWLVAGGKGKGAPYQPMVEASRGRVKGVLTVGADAPLLEEAYRGVLPVHPCGTLEEAVRFARAHAKAGDVVLLSPACASYDQFRHFEHRGDTFKQLVGALA